MKKCKASLIEYQRVLYTMYRIGLMKKGEYEEIYENMWQKHWCDSASGITWRW